MSKLLTAAALGAAALALAACGSSASSPAPASAAPSASGPVAPGTPENLSPLTLGHFPATDAGKLAKTICEQWTGLRQQYVQKITIDTAYQMNQWFSGPDWAKVQAASLNLNDPAFTNLEVALGAGMTGDNASDASAAAIDKACQHAD